MAVLESIRNLDNVQRLTKHQRIVKGVKSAIIEDKINQGQLLPSVNEMAGELGYARETIVKAYNELKDNGIINSKRGVGYFINNTDVDQKLSVAVLMYSFHDFQQSFYNTFREHVGENVNVDVFFHHNNPKVYESILTDLNGQYGMYVIAPIHHIDIKPYLSSIPPKRILIVDRYEYFGDDFSYVSRFESRSPRWCVVCFQKVHQGL